MDGFTKLFGSIVNSTVWLEDDATRLVWITMLAMKNGRHIVDSSVPGLASMARVPVDACRLAIKKLESPDPDSRHQEFDGRRIEKVEGGWLVLNGQKYQDKMSNDSVREYKRNWQRNYREKVRTERPAGPRGQTRAEAEFIKTEC